MLLTFVVVLSAACSDADNGDSAGPATIPLETTTAPPNLQQP